MAHAYETLARRGRFTYGSMSPGAVDRRKLVTPTPGPVGIRKIGKPEDGKIEPLKLSERRARLENQTARLARA